MGWKPRRLKEGKVSRAEASIAWSSSPGIEDHRGKEVGAADVDDSSSDRLNNG
jgi:hypothetical protein